MSHRMHGGTLQLVQLVMKMVYFLPLVPLKLHHDTAQVSYNQ